MTTTTTATATPAPQVSALIVSFNTREHLLRSLGSLEAVALLVETIVVDNASADGSAEAVAARFPAAQVVRNAENVGFGRACNQGLARAQAPYVLLLNSDAEVRPGAVETMAGRLDRQADLAAVGPRTRDGDGLVEVSFGPPLTLRHEWRQRRLVRGVRARSPGALRAAERLASAEHEPAWLSASCLLARREALRAVGGFDETFFLYEEDVDLCLRLRQAGWRLLYTPAAEVVHHGGRSMERLPERARREYDRSHLHYYRKHNGPLPTAALRAWLAASAASRWLRRRLFRY
jgi:GT2 family glycosyltransferase